MSFFDALRFYYRNRNRRSFSDRVRDIGKALAITAGSTAVNYIGNQAMRRAGLGTRRAAAMIGFNPVGKKGFGLKYSTTSAQLAGKIKGRRGARKTRRGRKLKTKKIVKKLYNGVSLQKEYTSNGFGDKCIYLGHCTNPMEETLYLLTMACFKSLMKVKGFTINDWNQARSPVLNVGDIVQYVYKPTATAGETSLNMSLTIAAGNVTYWDIVANLVGNIITQLKLGVIQDGIILTQFQLLKGGNYDKVDLQDANLSMFIKSSFKMQNRSVAAAGDDEMDVNNVPIYGKTYSGYGNGAVQRNTANITFLVGENIASPIAVDGSTIPNFAEPPHPAEFSYVGKSAKVYLNPGTVKTSVIKFKKVINVSTLMQKIIQYYWSTTNFSRSNLGVFEFVSLERVIGKLATEATPAINVTFEWDWKGYATLFPGQQSFTTPQKLVT